METIDVATIAASRHEKKNPTRMLFETSVSRLAVGGIEASAMALSYHTMMRTRRGFETRWRPTASIRSGCAVSGLVGSSMPSPSPTLRCRG